MNFFVILGNWLDVRVPAIFSLDLSNSFSLVLIIQTLEASGESIVPHILREASLAILISATSR